MNRRSLRRNKSGQVIVITALMVALVLLSTAIFVIGTEKDVPSVLNANNTFAVYQQATKNTLISALAYFTDGNPNVLTADLSELSSTITSNSYQSITQASFTPLNQAPYQNGIETSWGTNGQGISSGYLTLQVNSTGASSTSNLQCEVNVTTSISVQGSYHQVDNSTTGVNLAVNLQNEGAPALSQSLALYFQNSSNGWVNVGSPSISDFGNGTYSATFNVESSIVNFPIHVSAVCKDQRGITVVANSTCVTGG